MLKVLCVVNKTSFNFCHSYSKFTAHSLHLSNTQFPSPTISPQAVGSECKSRQNSFSSTIHLSTGLLGRKKQERERVSINHLTPGYIYALSNEFNKESSPWSNILSGTSSLSPSSTLPLPPSLLSSSPPRLFIPREASDCEVGEDASAIAAQTERRRTETPAAVSRLKLSHEPEIWRTSFPCS